MSQGHEVGLLEQHSSRGAQAFRSRLHGVRSDRCMLTLFPCPPEAQEAREPRQLPECGASFTIGRHGHLHMERMPSPHLAAQVSPEQGLGCAASGPVPELSMGHLGAGSPPQGDSIYLSHLISSINLCLCVAAGSRDASPKDGASCLDA